MVSDVINAITEALAAEFPASSGYRIYIDDVPQGFDPGSFIVTSIMPTRDKKSYSAYEYDELIAVQYNPQNQHKAQTEINEVIDRIADCLEVITITYGGYEKKTRTYQTDSNVTDGILTYTLRVPDVYFRLSEGDKMADVDIPQIGVING